jgi:tetratricopeptide (TPR) repeat protein
MLSRALMQIQIMVLASALTLTPSLLWAQSASDKSFAQEAFKKGQIQYNLGRFEKALGHFSQAYETMPHGAFLFNIGQCHRHLENHEKAIFFFEGYLRNLPNAPNRSDVEDLISEHRAKLAIAKTRKSNPKKKPSRSKKKKKRKPKKKASAAPVAEKSAPVAEAPQPPKIKSADEESWLVWALIGGVAVLGTAIVIATIATRADSDTGAGDGSDGDSGSGTGDSDASLGTVDIRPN